MKKSYKYRLIACSPYLLTAGALLPGACLAVAALAAPAAEQALPTGEVFAINAGGYAAAGYSADTNYTFGSVYANNSQQVNTQNASFPAPAAVYQDEREGAHFSYTLPGLTPDHVYVVILHFAELYWSRPYQRQFNVSINGKPELTNFDIVREAGGPFQAVDELFLVRSDANGTIEIDFSKGAIDQPLINAIEIRSNNG